MSRNQTLNKIGINIFKVNNGNEGINTAIISQSDIVFRNIINLVIDFVRGITSSARSEEAEFTAAELSRNETAELCICALRGF